MKQRILNFLQHPKHLFYLGLLATVALSLAAILAGRTQIFRIFRYGALYPWEGINPYTAWGSNPSLPSEGLDVFLYAPLFSILFYPFALLPTWLGALLWSVMSYWILLRAMLRVPQFSPTGTAGGERFRDVFFYVIVVMVSSLKEFQYNVLTAALCLWVYLFLEQRRYLPAMLLVIIGGLTKVYAGMAGLLFLFYPDFWREPKWLLRGVGMLLIALVLPILFTGTEGLLPYYIDWYSMMEQRALERFHGISAFIYVVVGYTDIVQYTTPMLLLGVLSPFALYGLLPGRNVPNSPSLRASMLGTLMLGMMVWGNSTEANTYIIGMLGWLLFYNALDIRTVVDKVAGTLLFIAYGVLPMDFLCPPALSNIILHEWKAGAVIGLLCWVWMLLSMRRVGHSGKPPHPDNTRDTDCLP